MNQAVGHSPDECITSPCGVAHISLHPALAQVMLTVLLRSWSGNAVELQGAKWSRTGSRHWPPDLGRAWSSAAMEATTTRAV